MVALYVEDQLSLVKKLAADKINTFEYDCALP
jgi:hypothetical protein